MRPAIVQSETITGDALLRLRPFFSLSPVTLPEIFAKVSSSQFPSRF